MVSPGGQVKGGGLRTRWRTNVAASLSSVTNKARGAHRACIEPLELAGSTMRCPLDAKPGPTRHPTVQVHLHVPTACQLCKGRFGRGCVWCFLGYLGRTRSYGGAFCVSSDAGSGRRGATHACAHARTLDNGRNPELCQTARLGREDGCIPGLPHSLTRSC